MPDTHARFSPSAANRRIHCPPSLLLEEQFEEGESVYAAEGTAGHALAEHLIRKHLKQRTTRPTSEYYKDELLEAVDEYVSFVIGEIEDARRECQSPVLLVEQRIDASEYVDGCFGTADMVIITDKVAHVIDLKLGKGVEVHAEENPQLMYSSRRPWNPMIARVSLQIISIRFCRRIGMGWICISDAAFSARVSLAMHSARELCAARKYALWKSGVSALARNART